MSKEAKVTIKNNMQKPILKWLKDNERTLGWLARQIGFKSRLGLQRMLERGDGKSSAIQLMSMVTGIDYDALKPTVRVKR